MPSARLVAGDVVVVTAGDLIPADGDVVEGIATVDESAITGESAPVIRESGGDRSAVTGGTRVLSDQIVVLVTAKPGESFLDRMIALVEGAVRRKTPNEIALDILLAGLTIIFLIAVVTLQPFAIYSDARQSTDRARRAPRLPHPHDDRRAALRDRHRRAWTASSSGTSWRSRAAPSRPPGDCDVLLLDKTGTITLGNRQATELIPRTGRHAGAARRRRPALEPRRRDPGRAARSSSSRRSGSGSASATSTARRSSRSRRTRG